MKRKLFSVGLSLILLLIFAAPALAQGPSGAQVVFGDNFVLKSDQKLDRDLVVFGGNVKLESGSTLNGDLIVFGGNVDVEGTVNGDIGLIGGNINVNRSAVIDGDIGMLGGNPNVSEGAAVKGEIKSITSLEYDYGQARSDDDDDEDEDDHFEAPFVPGAPAGFDHGYGSYGRSDGFFGFVGRIVGDIVWTISLLIILGAITWLVAAFMPGQMNNVRETLVGSAPLSFGIGLMTLFVALVFIPIAILLLITICLAVVPIVAYLVLGVATLFGWIVVGQIIGERLLVAGGRSQPDFVFSSVLGVLVLTLIANMPVIGQIPCIGFLLGLLGTIVGFAAGLTGLGAVLLTRFGTRLYPAPSYSYAGRSPSSGSGLGSPTRWVDPEPEVSEEDLPASEADLNAKIKAALAEADDQPDPESDDPSDNGEPPAGDPDPEEKI